LAYDYCVYFTASDGAMKGFEVVIFPDLTQPVGAPEGSIDRASQDLKEKGVKFIPSDQVAVSVG
jgi:nicotinamidase-related amidase